MRRSWTLTAAGLAALGAIVAATAVLLHVGLASGVQTLEQAPVARRDVAAAGGRLPTCRTLPAALRAVAPPVAYVRDGSLRVLDLGACEEAVPVLRGATGPVAFSADRRWIGYDDGIVTTRSGERVERPLGTGIWRDPGRSTWAWSPDGERLAGVTTEGGLVLGAPGGAPRQLAPDGWGATDVVWATPGTLLVSRGRAIWRFALDGGRLREPVYVAPNPQAALRLAAAGPGWAVFWRQPYVSASGASDGAPLLGLDLRSGVATPLAGAVLMHRDFVVGCGPRLAITTGGLRDTTAANKAVALVTPGTWAVRRLGRGVSPACSADGRTVVFARGAPEDRFGHERRTLWLAQPPAAPRQLTPPTTASSAEAPWLSADGRGLFWVRTAGLDQQARARGALMGALLTRRGRFSQPRVLAPAGLVVDFYGRYAWPDQLGVQP